MITCKKPKDKSIRKDVNDMATITEKTIEGATAKADPAADPTLDYLLTTADVAKLFGCNQSFVKDLIEAGALVALKFGRLHRIRKVSINKFLQDYDGKDVRQIVNNYKKIARATAG